jgi:hypothetical protein
LLLSLSVLFSGGSGKKKNQEPREKKLIFGRFSSKQLGIAAAILMAINFFVIMLIAKAVENASRQTIFIVMIGSVFLLTARASIMRSSETDARITFSDAAGTAFVRQERTT